MTDTRKPQPGEVWVRRDGALTGPMTDPAVGYQKEWSLCDPMTGMVYRADGRVFAYIEASYPADLIRIHEPAQPDTLGVKAHDTAQAVIDLQARVEEIERLQSLTDALESIEVDKLIARYGSDTKHVDRKIVGWASQNIPGAVPTPIYETPTPDTYAAGYWIPHTGDECPVPVDRRCELVQTLTGYEKPSKFMTYEVPAGEWTWLNYVYWRYADPIAAKTAYEAWTYGANAILTVSLTSDEHTGMFIPEFPWYDYDRSDKCPVPKRRRGEVIDWEDVNGLIQNWNCGTIRWNSFIKRWRYTQPDPGKSRKWGPWKCDIAEWDRETGPVQCEYHGGKYIRHRVRL